LGEHLAREGSVSEELVYQALSFQQGLPAGSIDVRGVPREVAHALPEHVVREWGVLPFRVREGSLFVASAQLPTPQINGGLRSFTQLEVRFHLVTPTEFQNLAAALL